jgi:hypothetical protein
VCESLQLQAAADMLLPSVGVLRMMDLGSLVRDFGSGLRNWVSGVSFMDIAVFVHVDSNMYVYKI